MVALSTIISRSLHDLTDRRDQRRIDEAIERAPRLRRLLPASAHTDPVQVWMYWSTLNRGLDNAR
jgi:hypothetical protein